MTVFFAVLVEFKIIMEQQPVMPWTIAMFLVWVALAGFVIPGFPLVGFYKWIDNKKEKKADNTK